MLSDATFPPPASRSSGGRKMHKMFKSAFTKRGDSSPSAADQEAELSASESGSCSSGSIASSGRRVGRRSRGDEFGGSSRESIELDGENHPFPF